MAVASLPMYDLPELRAATDAWWRGLAQAFRREGIADLPASSVKKKMKSKGFARTVNRDDIVRGAAEFGVELTEHIQFMIDAMKPHAATLGLLQGLPADESPTD